MSDIKIKNEPNEPVNATAEFQKALKEAVAEALKVAIPAAAVGITQAQNSSAKEQREMMVREAMRKTKRCPICNQPESACGGAWPKDEKGNAIETRKADGTEDYSYNLNHELAYVGPKDDNLFKWFQGLIVNGHRYLSDYPGHKIWIPKKSDILTQVNAWEQNEKDLMQKRTAEGQGMSVGPGGVKRSNQYVGWR